MAAHTSKLAVAVLMGVVLFVPAGADASHSASRRCAGRVPTLLAHEGAITRGSEGDDVILGTPAPDTIMALGGDDIICGDGDDDVIYAGEGEDRVFGQNGDNQLFGGAGTDLLYGGSGADLVMGQDDDDVVRGGIDGTPQASVRDVVSGGAGDDLLLNGASIDSFVGGDGDDSFVFRAGVAVVDLSARVVISDTDTVDSIAGVENVLGFPEIRGDVGEPVDPVIRGDGGANVLVGGEGSDHIYGEGGNDLVDGFCGLDHLDGGSGSEDVASFRFLSDVNASLEGGTTTSGWAWCGGANRNSALLTQLEGLAGGPGRDVLVGSEGNNYIYGFTGFDILSGLAGDDVLDSSTDGGRLSGGDGIDRCLNGESAFDCETAEGPAGPRRRGAVELLQRFARILEMIETAQRMTSR